MEIDASRMNFSVPTELCEIMGRNLSDKGSVEIERSWHNYTVLYHYLFKPLQDRPLRVFELGLGTNNTDVPSNMGPAGRPGASLYGWREFFPHAKVYGADIDRRVLFDADRIRTYYCDQTNPEAIREMWATPELAEDGFDIIVEDGLHTHAANVCFFENSIHKLNVGGYYVIEDILRAEAHLHEASMHAWGAAHPELQFALVTLPSRVNTYDNAVMVVHRPVPATADASA
jgi:hypothetical protein